MVGTAVPSCTGIIVGESTPEAEQGTDGDAGGKEDEPSTTCQADPCELKTQCGCEIGQACDLDPAELPTAGTHCREATPTGQSQAACSTSEECAAGYGCFGAPGQCRKYCAGHNQCGFGHCIINVTYSDGGQSAPVPDATVCSKACKPESATGSGCPSTFGCFPYRYDPNGVPDTGDEFWYSDCRTAATTGGRHDASCEAKGDSDCAPGYNCLRISYSDGTSARRCRQTCVWQVGDKVGDRVCSGGRTCAPLNDIIIGDTEYGSCR
jgi:hypothetical protein